MTLKAYFGLCYARGLVGANLTEAAVSCTDNFF
jgi:hypothetical protein